MDANDQASIEQGSARWKTPSPLSAHLQHGYAVEGLKAETVGSLYPENGVSTPQALAKSSTGTSTEQQSDR